MNVAHFIEDIELERLCERIYLLFYGDPFNPPDEAFVLEVSTIREKLGPNVPFERLSKAVHLLEESELVVQLPEKTGCYRLTGPGKNTRPMDLVARRLKSELKPAEDAWKRRSAIWWSLVGVLSALVVVPVILGVVLAFFSQRSFSGISFLIAFFSGYIMMILYIARDLRNPKKEIQLPIRMYRGYEFSSTGAYKKAEKEFKEAAAILETVRILGWKSLTADLRSMFTKISHHIKTGLLGPISAGNKLDEVFPKLLVIIDQFAHPSLTAFQKATEEITSLPEKPYEPRSLWKIFRGRSTDLIMFLVDAGVAAVSYYAFQAFFSKDTALIAALTILMGIPLIWFSFVKATGSR